MDYPKSYQNYATQFKGRFEVINGSLWDTQQYAQAGQVQLTFFTATRATVDLSNMEVAGQLPFPKAFLIRALKIHLKQRPESVNMVAATNTQTGAINNICQVFNTGSLQITIGSKQYGIYPLWIFAAGNGPFGVMGQSNVLATGGMVDYAGMGAPVASNAYTFSVPMFIEPQMNFKIDLYWGAAAAIVRATNLTVLLEGDLIRSVQ